MGLASLYPLILVLITVGLDRIVDGLVSDGSVFNVCCNFEDDKSERRTSQLWAWPVRCECNQERVKRQTVNTPVPQRKVTTKEGKEGRVRRGGQRKGG